MTFQQQVKHALAVLAVYSVIGTAGSMAWAASGVLQTIQLSPDKHALLFRNTGPVTATMNSMRVGPNQRIILDLRNAEIGVELPRDPLLLQELASQWAGIRNISINQFGGSEPIVRILLDVDGSIPAPQLVQVSGNVIELKLAGSVPITSPTTGSPVAAMPTPPEVRIPVSAPYATPSAVDAHSYQTALKTIEEQRALLQKLQTELFQLKAQGGGTPQNGQYLQQEADRLRTANQSLQNQLFNLYEQQKQFKEKETQLLAAQAQSKKLQDELVWLKAENDKLSSLPAAKAVTPTEMTQLRTELDNARTALSKSVMTINTQNKEIATLKTRIGDVQKGLDASAKDQLTTLNEILIQKEAELEKRNTEAVQLRKEVAAFKAQPAIATQAEVDSLRRQLAEMTTQYRNAVAESNRQQQLTAEKVNEHSQLKQNSDNMAQQLQYLENELSKANARYSEALANYNRLQSDQAKATGQAEKDTRIAQLEQQLTAAQQKHQAGLDETQKLTLTLNTQNRELRDKVASLELENTSLKTRSADVGKTAALEKQTQELSLKLSDAEKEINRLYTELASKVEGKTEVVARLEQENSTLSRQLDDLKTQLQKEQADKQASKGQEDRLGKLQAENQALAAQLQSAVKGHEVRLGELQNENQSLMAQLKAAQSQKSDQSEQAKALESALNEKQTLADALAKNKKEQADQAEQLASLEADLQKARKGDPQLLTSLQEEVRSLATANQDLQKRLEASASADASVKTLETSLQDKTEQIDKLKQENASLLTALQNKSTEPPASVVPDPQLADLQARLDTRDAELASAKGRLQTLEEQLKEAQSKTATKKTPASPKEDKKLQAELVELKQEAARLRQELSDARNGSPQAMVATAHPQADKHFQLGRDFETNGQADLALQEYQRAASLSPTTPEYVFRYSLALAENKQFEEAISQLQAYLAQHPGDREAFNQIGKVYLLNNQADEAKSAFRHAIPSSVLNNYATVLKKQGKVEEAEQFFKLAVELNPGDSDILFNLGNLYNTASKLNEARTSYEKAIGLRPDFAEAHYNLGLVYSKMGDNQSAVTHLERFLDLTPDARNAEAIRAYLKKLKGDA